MPRFLVSVTAIGALMCSSAALADPSTHSPGSTAEQVEDVCRELVPGEFESIGECVSTFRGDIVELCKFYAESGVLGDASAGRCIEVFSQPREEGDD